MSSEFRQPEVQGESGNVVTPLIRTYIFSVRYGPYVSRGRPTLTLPRED